MMMPKGGVTVTVALMVLVVTTTTLVYNPCRAFVPPRLQNKQINPSIFATTKPSEHDVILQALEKRLQQGPGAIDSDEISAVEAAVETMLQGMTSSSTTTTASPQDLEALRAAVVALNATAVTEWRDRGVLLDDPMVDAAFWAVVHAVDTAEAQDLPLSADVPRMLHHIFDADARLLRSRKQVRTNVTCMQPLVEEGMANAARRMNYIFDDMAHKHLPLMEGRRCEDGSCCDACSRNIFPTFASEDEVNLEVFDELQSLTFNELEKVKACTIIQFVRLIERVRRTIAYEYGLPLSTILPLQAYSRKYVAGTTQQGGGGGEGDFVILHTDESTHSGYHYSCVLYLSTSGVDFEGGDFVFNDPAPKDEAAEAAKKKAKEEKGIFDQDDDKEEDDDEEEFHYESLEEEIRRAGRVLTPYSPTRGAAVIFSSGWENMHEVEKITSGVRYAVPCFFTTCPVPQAHYDLMKVGKPASDEDIADDWLHLLLVHRKETPMEAVGRVKELLMKWHYMCTPLDQHVD